MVSARRVVPFALLLLSLPTCASRPKDAAGRLIFANEFSFETTRTDDPYWCFEHLDRGDKSSKCRENKVLCDYSLQKAGLEGATPLGECRPVDAMTCHLYCPGLGCGDICFETPAHCEASYLLRDAPASYVSACTTIDRNYKPPAD